jgi:hypothetical protein
VLSLRSNSAFVPDDFFDFLPIPAIVLFQLVDRVTRRVALYDHGRVNSSPAHARLPEANLRVDGDEIGRFHIQVASEWEQSNRSSHVVDNWTFSQLVAGNALKLSNDCGTEVAVESLPENLSMVADLLQVHCGAV